MTDPKSPKGLWEFLTSFKGIILTAGAIAAAVSSILAFVPKPTPTPGPSAVLSHVRADPDYLTIKEFEESETPGTVLNGSIERAPTTPHIPGYTYRLADYVVNGASKPAELTPVSKVNATGGEEEEEETSSKTPLTKPEESKTPEPTNDAGTTQSTRIVIKAGSGVPQSTVASMLADLPQQPKSADQPTKHPPLFVRGPENAVYVLPFNCGLKECPLTMAFDALLSSNPKPAKAARELLSILKNSRSVIRNGYQHYPLGVVVDFKILLENFAGQKPALIWRLIPRHGRLGDHWLRGRIVQCHLHPKIDKEGEGMSLWIPLPRDSGDYRIRLLVLDDQGTVRGEGETGYFH